MRSSPLTLTVAGVRFHIRSGSREILPPSEPAYALFQADDSPAVFHCHVDVHASPPPPASPAALEVFRAGRHWRLLRNADGPFRFERIPAGTGSQPPWTALPSAEFDHVDVYCPGVAEGAPLPSPVVYPLDLILLMHILSRQDGVLVHSAAVTIDGQAVVLAGVSGAGKTTSSRLLAARGFPLLSDDRVILRREGGRVLAFGSPWPGEGGFARPAGYPLKALLFLRKSARNRVVEIPSGDAARAMIPLSSVPWYDLPAAERMLATIRELCARTRVGEFEFQREDSAVDALVAALE